MITSRFVAVVTAAGEATRFRPFSHAIPKEMLPIGARPALDLVIDECVAAGANEVIVVTPSWRSGRPRTPRRDPPPVGTGRCRRRRRRTRLRQRRAPAHPAGTARDL